MKKILFLFAPLALLLSCHRDPEPDPISYDFIQVTSEPQYTSCDITCLNESVQNSDKVHARLLLSLQMDMDEVEVYSMVESASCLKCHLSNLTEGTRYYFTLEAYSNSDIYKSKDIYQFTTSVNPKVTVTTGEMTNITQTTARGSGMVVATEDVTITERGLCLGTEPEPTTHGTHFANGYGTGEFFVELSELSPNTKYYVRAYAVSALGTEYGSEVSFSTNSIGLPKVETSSVTDITATTAIGHGVVTDQGDSAISERGFCWSTEHNPTTESCHIVVGDGLGEFDATIDGLEPNTKYYLCSYASNGQGTSYGSELEFITEALKPTVVTTNVSNITQTTAFGGGEVTSDGGADVIERGICWSTEHEPTIDDNYGNNGTGIGRYNVDMNDLNPNTIYYVRAYATNIHGISYGNEVGFRTAQNVDLPTVTTSEIMDITETTATGGGNVTNDGGGSVIAKGICWSTNPNPTIEDSFTINGADIGSFTSSLTDLMANTTYYVRAFATNEIGTAYGSELNFKTLPKVPVGVINGLFTINANGDQVWFSKGNLQYQASTNTWRFAEHQWDCIGEANSNISPSYSGWIDLFGWGTSSYDHGAVCYQPWSVSTNNADYYAYGDENYNLYDQSRKADWGYNAISNGGNEESQWRTLTGGTDGEWKYLFDSRITTSGVRYVKACVNGMNGVILVPDNWSVSTYSFNGINFGDADYSVNIISLGVWENTLDPAGCVFLPAAGGRNGTSVINLGVFGYYWSSSFFNGSYACDLYILNSSINSASHFFRYYGFSLRLVTDN